MGLGNPGLRYQETRHNAGFWFLDQWAGILGLPFRKAWFRPYLFLLYREGADTLILVKPMTYVNRTGTIFSHLQKRFSVAPTDILVVFDQMDLPPGRVRLKPHGSAAGHNGLKSIDSALGGGGYPRLALGVGRPLGANSVVDHVLGPLSNQEREAVDSAFHRILPQIHELWKQGWEPLINAVNRRDSGPL